MSAAYEGERAAAVVLEAVPFGAPRREGQEGIETVQGLGWRLYHRRRIRTLAAAAQIEPEDVCGFAFELAIVVSHIPFQTVRLEARFLPNAMHSVFADGEGEVSLRQLQCVDPSLGFLRVADRMLERRAGVSTLGYRLG